jgi:hypothetical protein
MLPLKGGNAGFLVFRALADLLLFGGGGATSDSDTEDGDVSAVPAVEEASFSPGGSFIRLKSVCCAIIVMGRKTIRGRTSLFIVGHLANFLFSLYSHLAMRTVPMVAQGTAAELGRILAFRLPGPNAPKVSTGRTWN